MAEASRRDPGLAAERTDIAWARSALAAMACLAALLRRVPTYGAVARYACIGAVMALMVVIVVFERANVRRRADPAYTIDHALVHLRHVASVVFGVGVLCFAVVMLSWR
jgi:uncharacterized membrane protein YidH (DUF202 family)